MRLASAEPMVQVAVALGLPRVAALVVQNLKRIQPDRT